MKNKRERTRILRAARHLQRLLSLENMKAYVHLEMTPNICNLLSHYCEANGLLRPQNGLPQIICQEAAKSLRIYRAGDRSLNLRKLLLGRNAGHTDNVPEYTVSLWEDSSMKINFIWHSGHYNSAANRLILPTLLKDWLILRKDTFHCAHLIGALSVPAKIASSGTITLSAGD